MAAEQRVPRRYILRRFFYRAILVLMIGLLAIFCVSLFTLRGHSISDPISRLFRIGSSPLFSFSGDVSSAESTDSDAFRNEILLHDEDIIPDTDAAGMADTLFLPDEGAVPEQITLAAPSSERPRPADALPVIAITQPYTAGNIMNTPKVEFNAEKLLAAPLPFSMDPTSKILIIHTHAGEKYMPENLSWYTDKLIASGSSGVVDVGECLRKELESYGYSVIHDQNAYDEPFSGAYKRTFQALEEHLSAHPEIEVVIDLHRDSVTTDEGVKYKLLSGDDSPSAQLMLVMGSDASSLSHPAWRENMKLALKLEKQLAEDFPDLARPILISKNRYNQHLTYGSFILEVGTDGNTLEEACASAKKFASALNKVLTAGN